MNFKDALDNDLSVFFNTDEFAETHDLNGQQVICLVMNQGLEGSSSRKDVFMMTQGIYISEKTLLVRTSDIRKPIVGEHFYLDNELYVVGECNETKGVYEVTLEANES